MPNSRGWVPLHPAIGTTAECNGVRAPGGNRQRVAGTQLPGRRARRLSFARKPPETEYVRPSRDIPGLALHRGSAAVFVAALAVPLGDPSVGDGLDAGTARRPPDPRR